MCGTNSERIKERLLREQDLTLDKALHTCRADEESNKQLKSMDDDVASSVVVSVVLNMQKESVQHLEKSAPNVTD